LDSKWYVYILECNDGTYYTGITNDLDKRIQAHNDGKGAKYTRSRVPVQLVWFVESENRSEATSKEFQIKKLTRKKKEILIKEGDN
jgi:putative endonuclease